MPDPAAVNSMFGRIAHRYDLTNRVLSVGIDLYWRARLVSAVRKSRPGNALDLATGSGDVALALAKGLPRGTPIVGMDFCAPMLVEAEAKLARVAPSLVEFKQGDALRIPLADGSFDAVTIAFGLRNMADRAKCLSEIRRVLRPQGRLFVLEFSQPWPWVRPLYAFHMRSIAPRVAGALTGDRGAYDYLRESIGAFPGREALSQEIRAAGFSGVTARAMTMGVVALHVARR
ncbi:MAG TPA: bifunctional demethylmenaquinone methyltransferase/2-methoxy-6-polyprenyl-1,4-benzoquinol methylase UbiE [Opitutaceae bacterium]